MDAHGACKTSVRGGMLLCMRSIIDGSERNIGFDCVDKLWMGGKTEKLKKVGHITVYRSDELEEDEKEVEWKVIEDGGEDVSIVPVVYPHGMVSVSSLGSF